MTMPLESRALAFLRKSTKLYEALVAHALRLDTQGDDEKTLRWIGVTAEIAWAAHPGRLSDGRLEAIAVRIGQRLAPSPADAIAKIQERETGLRRVLHVATTVYGTGGHTRLLENWIKTDSQSMHSLLLIDQAREPIRRELIDRVEASGGKLIVVPCGTTLLARARWLREVARSGYDFVILHHHPNDVVPLVAFATEGGPPIAVMNHADHVFWLGVSIADLVVQYRQFGAELSNERRGIRQSFLFPLPLDLSSLGPTRTDARARLNIPDADRMLLTIGSAAKYLPTERHRFFDVAVKLLDRNPDAQLYVVGVGPQESGVLSIPPHNRMTLLGPIKDPSDYQAAADLYLEGFPFGSYTALLETAARGVCPVLMPSPTAHNDMAGETALAGLIKGATDEHSYIAEVTALIEDPDEHVRRGGIIADRIRSHHGAEATGKYLTRLYAQLADTRHSVTLLPDRAAQIERHDLDLSSFQSSRMEIPSAEWVSTKTVLSLSMGELTRLFVISTRSRDTRLTPLHAKAWLSVIKRRTSSALTAAARLEFGAKG